MDDAMTRDDVVEKLRTDAAKCRRFAAAASDPEAADALRQIAADIEAAIPLFEARRSSEGSQ